MAKPVGVQLTEDGLIYVVNDDGSVFKKRVGIGDWEETKPVPNTRRAREEDG